MEVDEEDDVTAVEINEPVPGPASNYTDDDDRPIMLLFKKLIGNENRKKKMLLTDAQIKEMLSKEFSIDTDAMHDMEVDIYLTVTKKFLKSWPQWNSFNYLVNGLQSAKDYSSLKKIYDKKYIQFKEYLGAQLEATKHLAAESVQSVVKHNMENTESSDLVIEIGCTRSHLNRLINRDPGVAGLFCGEEQIPTLISVLNEHTIETILNWWSVSVTINLSMFSYKRQTRHELEHLLINNTRRASRLDNITLDQDPMTKPGWRKAEKCGKRKIVNILEKILLQYTNNIKSHYFIETVFNLILDDLTHLPAVINVPGIYRQYSNKCKYVRYLSSPHVVEGEAKKYDIQLQETIAPRYEFELIKVDMVKALLPPIEEWLSISCLLCNEVFPGQMIDGLLSHFNIHHLSEPDWSCSNCKESFKMIDLAKQKWRHDCN